STPRANNKSQGNVTSPWDLEVGSWSFANLVRRLRRLRLFVGDVLDGAGVRHLQPLAPERVVDERVRAVRVLRLDVAQLEDAHVVRIRVAVQIAVNVHRDLRVSEILLEALDAREELLTALDAVARARSAEHERLVR